MKNKKLWPLALCLWLCLGVVTWAQINVTSSGGVGSPAGGVTGYFADGTLAAPSVAFASDADGSGTGMYRSGANQISFANNGSLTFTISGGVVRPGTNNAVALGGTTNQFADAFLAKSIQGSNTKTLTESSATTFVSVSVANSTAIAGRITYIIRASDATNTQAVSGSLFFSAVADSAGTVTGAAVSDQHTLNPVSTGTLTNTMTQATAANLLTFSANAASSLTQTTLRIDYRVELLANTATVTAL